MNGVEMAFIRILGRGLEEEQKRVIRSSETRVSMIDGNAHACRPERRFGINGDGWLNRYRM